MGSQKDDIYQQSIERSLNAGNASGQKPVAVGELHAYMIFLLIGQLINVVIMACGRCL